jgi:hypothetical protein
MKPLLWLSLAILIITAQVWFMGGFKEDDHVASAYVKERHRFHGISGSEIYRGEHTFVRDGKRCKL